MVVTGAARGIGLGLVRSFLGDGWDVVATVRSDPSELKALGARVAVVDVAGDVSALVSAVGDRQVDVLINNAGRQNAERSGPLEADLDDFALTLAVNTVGPLRVVQALLPQLARGSKVINVSSRLGSLSYAKSDSIAYRASKSALNKITQALATDLVGRGVVVVSVHPGWVQTDMGGGAADLDVGTSVAGLRAVIAGLTLDDTGSFRNYDGTTAPW